MRFGVFHEHQLPRPWEDGAEERLVRDAVEQVEVADRCGLHSAWVVEHHFLEEYSHSSAPEVFLAACSQRTERIRLGFGIQPLPPGYQHPARVAEKAATLDLLSGGRVELGTGETSSAQELGGFGVDRATKREQWAESLDVVCRMLAEEPFAGHQGRFLSVPPRNVVPKPRQRPHPPLWVACSRRDTIRLAAERGLGALSFSFVEPEEARPWIEEYRAIVASERCVPAGFAVNPKVAVVLPMMCHPDEATALERGLDGAHFFGYALAHYYVFGEHRPGRTSIWEEFQRRREDVGFSRQVISADGGPLGVKILQQGLGSLRGAIGTPEQVRDLARRYREAGVDELIFCLQAGPNRHEHICESLELFAREVLPEFAETADEDDRRREERMAEPVRAALARRPEPRRVDPEYVVPSGTVPEAEGDGRPSADGDGRAFAQRLAARGEAAFAAFVRSSGDRRLERTIVSPLGLRAMFLGMERRFQADRAGGFSGEIQYELSAGGTVRPWVVSVDGRRASARPGRAADPRVTLRMASADFARLAAGDLDPGRALLTGRLHLEGDVDVAVRLAEMFGAPSSY